MKKVTHTKEERDIESAINKGDYKSVYSKQVVSAYEKSAKQTFAKQRTVNVRISERNLVRLKAAAARQGMSYQTYITSLIQRSV